MSPAEVLKLIKEKGAKFVDLRFTDTRGKEQHVTVPVMKEEVHVDRVPVTDQGAHTEGAFEPGEIEVPVREETVEVSKRPVVKEEIQVSKEAHPEEESVEVPVRKEVAEVEEESGGKRKPRAA